MPERKFRIQSDWSDTGPNSTSINEIDASGNNINLFFHKERKIF